MSELEDQLRRELSEVAAGAAAVSDAAVSPVEEALRRALAEPPLRAEDLPDEAAPLAGLGRRVARARRRRAVASAASVVVVLAFGVSGAAALSRPIPQSGQAAIGEPRQGRVAAPTPAPRESGGAATTRLPTAPVDGPVVLGSSVQAAVVRRPPPPEVLAAARQALRDVIRGMPTGVLRWVQTAHGDMVDYRVQIPLRATTTCAVCQDPAGVPSSGAVIEFTFSVPAHRASDAAATGPRQPFPSFTLTADGTDLRRSGTVYECPFHG